MTTNKLEKGDLVLFHHKYSDFHFLAILGNPFELDGTLGSWLESSMEGSQYFNWNYYHITLISKAEFK